MQLTHPMRVKWHGISQVSEQQLKEAVAQAVESNRFGKERQQWSTEGKGINAFTETW